MAYINVIDWKCEQVIDWMKGLGLNNLYMKSFANNQIGGRQLLNIRPYELEELGIVSIGHQETILEAVEHLKNFHYNLDKENLQFLALQVVSISTSLYKLLSYNPDTTKIETQILSDVTRVISKIKTLVAWLDRFPFQGQTQYLEMRTRMLKFGLELATIAQRDRFVENPVKQIKNSAQQLSKFTNYIIQDITDPMLLQPSSLDLITWKKRESDLGFYIMPSYQFIHRVTDVKFNSPAHTIAKIEDGDEIVQINYQTVVGWTYKKVLLHLQESPTDILLSLKKRPKHTKIYGQICLIKLPNKKRSLPYRWDSLPSPRVELFNMQDILMPLARVPEKSPSSDTEESSSSGSDILTPTDIKASDKDLRLYLPKPRAAILQRRHSISGDDLMNYKNIGNLVLWHERKFDKQDVDSPSLRDKSVSFGFGLDTRPTTCLGIGDNSTMPGREFRLKSSLPNMSTGCKKKAVPEQEDLIEDTDEQKFKSGVSKVVRFDSNMKLEEYRTSHDPKYTCNVADTIIESFLPIPFVDDEVANDTSKVNKSKTQPSIDGKQSEDTVTTVTEQTSIPVKMTSDGLVEAVNVVLVNKDNVRRGKLDKSYSTPAYDEQLSDSETPPAIEPRREHLMKIPPVPPRKTHAVAPTPPPPPPPAFCSTTPFESNDENKSKLANVIDLKSKKSVPDLPPSPSPSIPPAVVPKSIPIEVLRKTSLTSKPFLEEPTEALELLTPHKTKTLTNRKKNSLMAKRRKVTLKSLGTSTTIQGHLYRRSKDKTGVAYWAKYYFVLIETALYGFKIKEALKADCLVFLNGFTVSLAKEVYSKQFAFKVYHPKKTFYLAAESSEALAQWMDYIKQATMKGATNTNSNIYNCELKELFSETECSEDELDLLNKQLCTPSPLSGHGEKSNADHTPTTSRHYHLNFGSLKKFARGSSSNSHSNTESSSPSDHKFLGFFSSNKSSEKKTTDMPVPTAQFKSYRKVQGSGNGGLQLGATSMINSTVSDMYLSYDQSPMSSVYLPETPTRSEEIRNEMTDLFFENTLPGLQQKNMPSQRMESVDDSAYNSEKEDKSEAKKLRKAHNYIHASNPNLLDFNFHAVKSAIDFPIPKNSASNWEAHSGPPMGFVTLEDLMLERQAEEARDMYNRRVEQGIEHDDKTLPKKQLKVEKPEPPPKPLDALTEMIQKRSLPITPDYAQSFKPNDQAILYTRSKEGQKLRDFGYELISGDDDKANKTVGSWKRGDKIVPSTSGSIKKSGLNWMTQDSNNKKNDGDSSSGSFRKSKTKFEQLKMSSDKLFQFKNPSSDTRPTKSYTPMTLPLNKTKPGNFTLTIDKVLQQKHQQQIVNLKKSNTYNTPDFPPGSSSATKVLRKNSAPNPGSSNAVMTGISYFSKLSFGNSSNNKEKKLLGSPKLHRAIFGKSHSPSTIVDHEIFSPITFPKIPRNEPRPKEPENINDSASTSQINYPDLQSSLPPVFKPAMYSLKDNSSHKRQNQE